MSASTVAQDEKWEAFAACKDRMDEFFPEDGKHYDPVRTVRICAYCPVKRECLTQTMRAEGDLPATSRFGMYGALTGRERYELYRADPGRWSR
jgi:hypothetical protein